MRISDALATADEVRNLREVVENRVASAKQSGRLPPHVQIGDREFAFGEDMDGEPAVWIPISTASDTQPSNDDVSKVVALIDDIVVAVLKSGARHWPYFRFHSGQRSNDAAA